MAEASRYSDDELLGFVKSMRASAIGNESNGEIAAERQRALEYAKGEMKDLVAMKNRSAVTSSEVSDGIETAIPDLVEIFTGGDDIAAFSPIGPEDEEAAKQETDYILHVYNNENPGFFNTYTIIKDALSAKVGIAYVRWEPSEECEDFDGKSLAELMKAHEGGGELSNVRRAMEKDGEPVVDPMTGEPLWSFTVKRDTSRARVYAVPPEDFAVAPDTVLLKDTAYCSMRSRPRVYDLLVDGVSRDIIDQLPPYDAARSGGVDQARDTVNESSPGAQASGEPDDLRIVEVLDHYIRLPGDDDDETEVWRVRTAANETVLIDSECVNRIPFAGGSPYPNTHRFYGRSLADLLMEIQKIKTSLMRSHLDGIYFSLNQRLVVADNGKNEFTISDVLNNVPGMPIRAKSADAVQPIQAVGPGGEVLEAMEFYSTVSEQRTGIVRNAQGLNPDTLHDTAKGAMALMSNAQKRLRLIARVLGETIFKDLFLLLHATIRENATGPSQVRLNKKWVPMDPTSWAERNDMQIEIGLGASGKEHDMIGLQMLSQDMAMVAESPWAAQLLTADNAYNLLTKKTRTLGFKNPELYWTDPKTQPPQPPPPDPKMVEVQGKMQLQQQSQQFDQQSLQAKMQADMQTSQAKLQADAALAARQLEQQHELAMAKLQADTALREQQFTAEITLKKYEIDGKLDLQRELGMHKNTVMAASVGSDVHLGGEPG